MDVQRSLLDEGPVAFEPLAPQRTPLADDAWVDFQRGWLRGSDALFEILLDAVEWRADRRPMYDRVVDVPRLTRFFGEDEPLPHPALQQARDALGVYYSHELGEPFATAGMCLYRDGRDSVAWHGDRDGRSSTQDTLVAILSLGSPRALALRRRDRGPTLHRFALGHGDLLVMGGSCQRTWDHGVPKTAASVGPRISVQFRPRGVR